jgi:pyruvate/2-oxoacid:ferredoxin oxidoreductase alpha subunit
MNMREPQPAAPVLLSGNHAAAWAARLARPQVAPVYPITPQTPVLELLTTFQADGEFDAEIVTVESEHSVMSACVPASLAGARVFTATASQGLLLMHEVLHYAAGARAPIVMFNVNRTVASPWGFWPDQTDSMAQRDTGWIQYHVETAQEVLDTLLQAYAVAESCGLPVLVNADAFYVSHALEAVQLPAAGQVDAWLPPYAPAQRLDPLSPSSWGNVVTAEMYLRHRQAMEAAMAAVPARAAEVDRRWAERFGRSWGLVERYRCDAADTLFVTLGSLSGTAREAVDALRATGQAVGLVRLRLFRPLPAAALRTALAGARDVVVLDRNHSPGAGGVLAQELRAILHGRADAPARVHGVLAGVGGVNVSVAQLQTLAHAARSSPGLLDAEAPYWIP